MRQAQTQEIEVGPVRVDTGNDWMDLGFVIALLIIVALLFGWKRVNR